MKFTFPVFSGTGSASTSIVYVEVEAGAHVGTQTVLVLEGTAEAITGEQRTTLSAGQMALVPASVPHDVKNVGDGPMRFVGFFASSTLVSVFDDPIAPIGRRVVGTPLPDEGSLGAAGDGSRAR
jgi:quercetin dioxygenase-like cupin family protein